MKFDITKYKKEIIIVLILIALLVFFYPKDAGGGNCGMCMAGQYKWTEYNCAGFEYIGPGFFSEMLGIGRYATDSPGQLLCYGIVYGEKTCYDKSAAPRSEISCEGKGV